MDLGFLFDESDNVSTPNKSSSTSSNNTTTSNSASSNTTPPTSNSTSSNTTGQSKKREKAKKQQPPPTSTKTNVAPPKKEEKVEEPPGVWEFCDENNEWKAFDPLTTRLVEATFKRDMASAQLNHGQWAKSKGGWTIDFGMLENTVRFSLFPIFRKISENQLFFFFCKQEKATGKKVPVRRTPIPTKSKIYGCGQQQKRKNLMQSDELKNPHFEIDESKKKKETITPKDSFFRVSNFSTKRFLK